MNRFDHLLEAETVALARETAGPKSFCNDGFVFCIPARDEADRIERTLRAVLAVLRPGDGVVLVVNGTCDGTARLSQETLAATESPWVILDVEWRPGQGSAPRARRLALDIGAELAPSGILVSIDADTIAAASLRAAYREEFDRGADLVCGGIDFDPLEAEGLPAADPQSEFVVREYRALSREVEALIDPDPDNPWPHHGNIGGANFAIRSAAYRAVGGLPTPPSGEDRALLRRLEAFGLRVRFSDIPRVATSCRLDGKTPGGLADELRRSRMEPDPLVDEALEPAPQLRRRLVARAGFRRGRDRSARRAALAGLGLDAADLDAVLATSRRGAAWQLAEERSAVLRRNRMRVSDLERELPALAGLRDELRRASGDRSGIAEPDGSSAIASDHRARQ